MKYQVDSNYLIDCFKTIVQTPSPTGFYMRLKPILEEYAAQLGLSITYDHKSTAYITLEGQDTTKTVLVGAHADTIGYVVRRIDGDGKIRINALGGINHCNAESATVTVHTRSGKDYTGLLTCQSHSTHVYSDARSLERTDDTMVILLDADVHSKAEVEALGIRHGDIISVDPQFEYTETGYLKSRFIDDKGAVACCFTALKYLAENNLKPKYNTIFAFPFYEEVGLGGSYIPAGVEEYVAVDIGLVGPDYDGDERKVSICAKDVTGPYDYELTNRLIGYAEKAELDYAVDIFYRYSTDAQAAQKAGHDLRIGLFGMAVYCSHGRERTHVTGLEATTNLLLAYVLDI